MTKKTPETLDLQNDGSVTLPEETAAEKEQQALALATIRTTALAPLSAVNAGIAALQEAYGGKTYDVTTTAGLDAAKLARRTVREIRVRVEKLRKQGKSDLLALGKQVDSEAERITGLLQPLEDAPDEAIKAEEERKATEKAAKEQAERERIEAIQQDIENTYRQVPVRMVGATADEVQAAIDTFNGGVEAADEERFGEFIGQASRAKSEATMQLMGMLVEKRENEELQAELAVSRAAADKRKQEQDAREAALNAREAEQQRREAAALEQQAEEERKRQAAAAEAERAKQERARAVQRRIDNLNACIGEADKKRTAVSLARDLEMFHQSLPVADEYDDRLPEAMEAHARMMDRLTDLHGAAVARETQEAVQAETRRKVEESMAAERAERDRQEKAGPRLLKALRALMTLHEPEGRFQPSHYKPVLREAIEAIAEAEGLTYADALALLRADRNDQPEVEHFGKGELPANAAVAALSVDVVVADVAPRVRDAILAVAGDSWPDQEDTATFESMNVGPDDMGSIMEGLEVAFPEHFSEGVPMALAGELFACKTVGDFIARIEYFIQEK